jgi:hypothetical protein
MSSRIENADEETVRAENQIGALTWIAHDRAA